MKRYFNIIIALVLCFSFLTGITQVFAADDTQSGFEPGEYSEAVSMLNDLGIIKDTYFAQYDASLVMTRGEFASLAVTVLGLSQEADAASYEQKFIDVPFDSTFAKAINFATSLGLFNGTSQNEFSPDDPVYITQAIKVAVSMLGYREIAEHKGGYPTGYLAVARDLKILDDVVVNNDVAAFRGNVIVLMYNTLFAEIMDVTGIKGDSYSYEITGGVNLLSKHHKIYEAEGIVTSNWQYSISGATEDANYVVVDGRRFFTESSRAVGVVGKNVKYYYKDIGNTDVILTVREESNDIVNIKAGDSYIFDYDRGEYVVSGDNKEYTFRLQNYDIVYNYAYVSGDVPVDFEDILTPQTGSITLIDNNDDNMYEVVVVEEPEVLLYSTYDAYNEKIYDAYDRSYDVDTDDYDRVEISDINGNKVDFSKIEYGSVIMVYKAFENKSLRLIVCPDSIEGKVSEISEDSVTIDSNFYSFSPVTRLQGLLPGQTYESVISPGKSYKFYLNQYNQIVFHDVKAMLNLGYIVSIAQNGSGISSGMSAQIFTANDKLEVFEFAQKVRIETINGRSTYSASDVKTEICKITDQIYGAGINPDGRVFAQYGLNEDGEISSVVLPHVLRTKDEYDNPPSNYSFFKLDYILTQFEGPGVNTTDSNGKEYHRLGYVPANRSAGLTMTMEDSCSIFYVPEFLNASYQKNNFALQNIGEIQRDTRMYYYPDFDGTNNQLEAYSTDREVRLVNNLVWIKTNGHAKQITNSAEDNALVTSVSTVVSDDGEPLVKISVLESKSIYDIYSDDLNILSRSVFEDTTLTGQSSTVVTPTIDDNKTSIVPGDLIRFSTNAEGYVEDIALMYDSENHMITYQDANAFTKHNVQYRHTCGDVIDLYGNYAVLDVYGSSITQKSLEPHIASSYFRIYVYDHKTQKARVGTAADISIGDKVYLTMYYTLSTDGELIVYKGGN